MTQKTALVTGASRGLGAAMAEALALRGWHVVALARSTGGLEELDDGVKAAKMPGAGGLTLAPMDICNEDALRHLCLSVHERFGGLQLWVHAAIHAAPLAPAGSLDGRDWDKSIATNLRATGTLIPLIEPLLREGQGRAMFFDHPLAGAKFHGAYGATKAGQIALARSWAAENATIGPKVIIAEPAPMATATRARFHPGEDRARHATPRAEAARLIDLHLQDL